MRILILAVLTFSSFYYFWPKEKTVFKPRLTKVDSIDVIMSGTAKRVLTAEPKKQIVAEPVAAETESQAIVETERSPALDVSLAEEDALEQVEEITWSETEAAWNNELKDILYRLEPQESENMHKAYVSERETFLGEIENLLNEKQQKTSPDAIQEIEQMISGIEQKHEEKIKEIFGSHYEVVKEQYDSYMESSTPAPEEEVSAQESL
ncbi:hypothetical protein [Peredibacter starrii]|uniref:Uncharacterized protein n=1 Tax=Peredibacter starrii TaxID=28202 RepID=A0AAX4HVL6_9BACT|nr:hypothetical protein [Peredibacter starrii]WPU67020.1 hypothetical protein SOO65_09675 [Peredibacter starrii]